jgi:hypothetical protein
LIFFLRGQGTPLAKPLVSTCSALISDKHIIPLGK